MKIAILGLGQIGEYYLRDFKRFGYEIIVFKNSNRNSSLKKQKYIEKKYKIKIAYANNFNSFFNFKFDTLLICSPNKYHLKHLNYGIKNDKNIIIEKPIISLAKYSNIIDAQDEFDNLLKNNPKIIYLLINELFADVYKKIFNIKKIQKKQFIFNFHTKGSYNYRDIMDDLLPHFFSIFNKIYKYNKISNINLLIKKNSNIIKFKANNCLCLLNFKQKSKYKKFEFGFQNHIINRVENQNTKNNEILIGNSIDKKIRKIQNPLTAYIQKYALEKKINYNFERKKIIKNFNNCCKIYYA